MLKIEQFVEQQFGIKLTDYQLQYIAMLAADRQLMSGGRAAGKTTARKAALAYLQDSLKPVDSCADCKKEADGDMVIDHLVPRRHPGYNADENLRMVHRRCNKKPSLWRRIMRKIGYYRWKLTMWIDKRRAR